MKRLIPLIAIGAVTACGTGGGSSDTTMDKVYIPLTGSGITAIATTVSGVTAELDRDTGTLTYNGDVGQLNEDGHTVTFASGATMAVSGLDNTYSRLFVRSGSDPAFGAYGVDTEARDLPGGSALYDGETVLVVIAPEGLFDLTGDAAATVSFGSGSASLTLDNMSGTQTTGGMAPEAVANFGSITIADVDLTGNILSGGTTTVSTGETAAFDTTASGGLRGTFFGPSAEEIGGTINVTGDAASINGGFIASR